MKKYLYKKLKYKCIEKIKVCSEEVLVGNVKVVWCDKCGLLYIIII